MRKKRPVIDDFRGPHRFLSNFWPDGPWTLEHLFQAAKTDDRAARAAILSAATPGLAKRLGRAAPLRPTWDREKDTVMFSLLMAKFEPGTSLANQLLGTGNALLIEGNTWGDTYWGVCNGEGANNLGKMLMELRRTLRKMDRTADGSYE